MCERIIASYRELSGESLACKQLPKMYVWANVEREVHYSGESMRMCMICPSTLEWTFSHF